MLPVELLVEFFLPVLFIDIILTLKSHTGVLLTWSLPQHVDSLSLDGLDLPICWYSLDLHCSTHVI